MEFLVPEGYEPDNLQPFTKQNNATEYCEIISIEPDKVKTLCGTYEQKDLSELCLFPPISPDAIEYCSKCRVVVEAIIIANTK